MLSTSSEILLLIIVILLIVVVVRGYKEGFCEDFIRGTNIGSEMLLATADIINAAGNGESEKFDENLQIMKRHIHGNNFDVTYKNLGKKLLSVDTEDKFIKHIQEAGRIRASTAAGWSSWIIRYHDNHTLILETVVSVHILTRLDNIKQTKLESYEITLTKTDGQWSVVKQVFDTKQLLSTVISY